MRGVLFCTLGLAAFASVATGQQQRPANVRAQPKGEKPDFMLPTKEVQPGTELPGPPKAGPADDGLVDRARRRLEARASMLLDDIERATGASAARIDPLARVLERQIVDAHEAAKRGRRGFDLAWLDKTWSGILSSQEWRDVLKGELSDDMRAAFDEHEAAREDRLLAARSRMALVVLASELRLRAPQVAELEGPVAAWMEARIATRGQIDAGDVVGEMIQASSIDERLMPEQSARLRRMRNAKRPSIPATESPGDDLALGRGRYPEDDFVLEAIAITQAKGWLWNESDLLEDAAVMLGREYRRSARSSWKHGVRNLVAPIVDFERQPLWNAVVARESAERGLAHEPTVPLFTDSRSEHVQARAELVLALLDERLLLSAEQRASLRGPLQIVVGHEFDRGSRTFGAIDGRPVWRALRIEGRLKEQRGAAPRRELVTALQESLDASQRAEVGL